METIKEQDLRDNPSLRGELGAITIRRVGEKLGAVALEVHVDSPYDGEQGRHIFLTDAVRLLEVAAHIQRTLLPSPENEILDRLERIEKRLE